MGLRGELTKGRTIWGRSRESLPMVLKTRSCSLLTVASKSSPRAAMATNSNGSATQERGNVQEKNTR